MEKDFITITAIDKHSSETMSRSFSTKSEILLKAMVEEWEKEISYYRYNLVTEDDLEEFSEEIQSVLDELEVTN